MQMERQRIVQQKEKRKEKEEGISGFSASSLPLPTTGTPLTSPDRTSLRSIHQSPPSSNVDTQIQLDNDEDDEDNIYAPTKRSSVKPAKPTTVTNASTNRANKLQRLIQAKQKTTNAVTTSLVSGTAIIHEISDDEDNDDDEVNDSEGAGFVIENTVQESTASLPFETKKKRVAHYEETEINSNEENNDEFIPILPRNTDDIDLNVLASLPSYMQKDYVEALQRQVRTENRSKLLPVAAQPESFSQQQIQSYIKSSHINLKIDAMNAEAAKKFMSGKRIASEANREYLLEKDEGYQKVHNSRGYGTSSSSNSGSMLTKNDGIIVLPNDTLIDTETTVSSAPLYGMQQGTENDNDESNPSVHFTLEDILGKSELRNIQMGQSLQTSTNDNIVPPKELSDREKLSLYYRKDKNRYSKDNFNNPNGGVPSYGAWRGGRGGRGGGRPQAKLTSLYKINDKRVQQMVNAILPDLNPDNHGLSVNYDKKLKQQKGLGISDRLMVNNNGGTEEMDTAKTVTKTESQQSSAPTTAAKKQRITIAGVTETALPEYAEQFHLRIGSNTAENNKNIDPPVKLSSSIDNDNDDGAVVNNMYLPTMNIHTDNEYTIASNSYVVDDNTDNENSNVESDNVTNNAEHYNDEEEDDELQQAIQMSLVPLPVANQGTEATDTAQVEMVTSDNHENNIDSGSDSGGGFLLEEEEEEFNKMNWKDSTLTSKMKSNEEDNEVDEQWEDIDTNIPVSRNDGPIILSSSLPTPSADAKRLEALRWLQEDEEEDRVSMVPIPRPASNIVIELDTDETTEDNNTTEGIMIGDVQDTPSAIVPTESNESNSVPLPSASIDLTTTETTTEEALAEALGTAGKMAEWAGRVMRRELQRMKVMPSINSSKPVSNVPSERPKSPSPIIGLSNIASTVPPSEPIKVSSGTSTPNQSSSSSSSSDEEEITYISTAANKLANSIDLSTVSRKGRQNTSGTDTEEENNDEDNVLFSIQEEMMNDIFSSNEPTHTVTKSTTSSTRQEVPMDHQPLLFYSKERENSVLAAIEAEESALRLDVRTGARDSEVITESMRNEVMALLDLFGVPYIIAPMEAEAQCASLETEGLVDGVITDDSDAFLFGSRLVFKNIFEDKKHVEVYRSKDIERELGLYRDDLIRGALLLGSDYTNGVNGVGIVNAVEILRCFPDDQGLEEFRDWIHSTEPDTRKLSKQEKEQLVPKERFKFSHRSARRNWEVSEEFPNRAVLAAYRSPTVTHFTPAKFHETLQWRLPNLEGLRLVSIDKFGWSMQQANEHIQPVIRELTQKSHQTTLENYMISYHDNVKVAKIRSKRLRSAVAGLRGEEKEDVPDLALPDPEAKPKRTKASTNSNESTPSRVLPINITDSESDKEVNNGIKDDDDQEVEMIVGTTTTKSSTIEISDTEDDDSVDETGFIVRRRKVLGRKRTKSSRKNSKRKGKASNVTTTTTTDNENVSEEDF